MSVKFSSFRDALSSKYQIVSACPDEKSWDIYKIKWIDSPEQAKVANILYIIDIDVLPDLLTGLADTSHFLILCDKTTKQAKSQNGCHVYYLIYEGERHALENDLLNIFIDLNLFESSQQIRPLAVLRCRTLDELTMAGSELMGNPMVVLNRAYQVLAISSMEKVSDPFWNSLLINEYISINESSNPTLLKGLEYSENVLFPTKVPFPPSNCFCMCRAIQNMSSKKAPGYLVVFDLLTEFDDSHLEYLETINLAAINIMARNASHEENLIDSQTIFLSELLDGNEMPPAISSGWLEKIRWIPDSNLYVVVVRSLDNQPFGKNDLEKLQLAPHDRSIIYRGDIIIIISSSTRLNSPENDRVMQLKQEIRKYGYSAGMSRRFTSLENLNHYYQQALSAVGIAQRQSNKEPRLYPYTELWIEDLLNEIHDKVDLRKYCHPQLFELENYDKENHSELFSTLISYFDNNQSIQKTAEVMYLHRNTINYRLSKCEEILELNLSNKSHAIRIYISIKILEHLRLQ